jgi:hypothetical protein
LPTHQSIDFVTEKSVFSEGICLKAVGMTRRDVGDRRFIRLAWLRDLLDTGRLDGSLRWQAQEAVRS